MESRSHLPFTELDVWKKAREFKKEMESLAKTFPPEEGYRLSDQLIPSACYINANIAVGHGRFTYKDQLHFCIQARGSLSETLNHIIDAFDAGYLSKEQLQLFKTKTDEVGRLLNGYINFLRKNL
ncbi:MAG TPA: four helix bundle protein [Flavisolibacter sp.]|nr:four helix bundle protein [Flavisolibacter sp.]